MKNLKKVLALVLAFACAFTMFAGAAFTDQADIEAAEAVDMLTALGVIDGYEDGSFQPNETVTRAEMAKMIYTIRNGGNATVTQYEGYKTPFADVENTGHWAKGYIAYCYANGIIDGKSATSFDPDATVTGTEAAKMALVLIGYDAERAGLEGSSWTTNTINLATQKDLFKDFSISITGGCDRQYAAQLLYNTLWACTVRWSSDAEGYEDVVTYEDSKDGTTAKPLNVTVAKRYMGLEEFTGTYDGNSKVQGILDGRIQVTDESGTTPVTKTATYDLGLEWLGEEVKVLYKESKDGVDGLDPKDTVFGVYNTGETQVYNIVKGDLQDGDSAKNKIKFGDTEYTASGANIAAYENFVSVGNKAVTAFDKNGAYAVASNDAIKFVCDPSGDITAAYITDSQFGKVSTVTSDKIAIEGLGTKELKDCEVYEGVQAGDLVRYTVNFAGNKTVNVIEKADTVSGTISAYKASDNQVQIDGTWYKFGANKTVATDYTNAALAASNVGDEVVLIVDGDYYLAYDIISGYDDYAIVTTGKSEFGDQRVKLLMADGSELIVVVDEEIGGTTVPAEGAANGALMAYNLKSEKTKVDLNATSVKTSSGNTTFTSDNKTMNAGVGVLANDATIFLYSTADTKWKVYKANQLGNFTTDGAVSYIVKDGKAVAVAGTIDTFPTAGSDSVSYGYVTNRIDTKVNDDNVVQLSVWDGETSVTLNIDGSFCDAYVGDFIEFPVVADGALVSNNDLKIDDTDFTGTMGSAAVKVKTVESGRIITTTDTVDTDNSVIEGTDSVYVVNSDTMYIGVKSKDNASSTSNTVVPYTKATGEDFDNAYVIYEEDATTHVKTIKAIFIDEDNKLIPYSNGTAQAAGGIETIYDVTGAKSAGGAEEIVVSAARAQAGNQITFTFKNVNGAAFGGSGKVTFNVTGIKDKNQLEITYEKGKAQATTTGIVTGEVKVTNVTVTPTP